MTKNEFICEFAELLDVEASTLTPDTKMASLDSWDSVTYLSAMVLIDEKLGVAIRPDVLSGAENFGVILAAVGDKLQ